MTQFWLFTIEELDIGSMYNGENTKSQNTQHVSWTINLFLSLSQRKDIIFRNYFLSIESSVPLKKKQNFQENLDKFSDNTHILLSHQQETITELLDRDVALCTLPYFSSSHSYGHCSTKFHMDSQFTFSFFFLFFAIIPFV